MWLSEASAIVQERADSDILGAQQTLPIQTRGLGSGPNSSLEIQIPIIDPDDGTMIKWVGMAGGGLGKSGSSMEQQVNSAMDETREMNPHVIVANMGLHWLHLPPFRNPHKAFTIHMSVNYRDWLTQVYNMAMNLNETTLLLFKTTNFVCDNKCHGIWEKYSDLYTSFDNQTLEACYEENKEFIGTYDLTQPQIYDYCRNAQFTEVGVKHYNDQIFDFVREINENQTSSKLTVGIFNDHDVEGCYSIDDAIHHRGNMEIRLRLLSNTIESYLGCRALEVEYN